MRKTSPPSYLLSFLFWGLLLSVVHGQESEVLIDPDGQDEIFIKNATAIFQKSVDSSIYYFHQGLPYYLKRNSWVNYVTCNSGLASCYYYKGKFKSSLHYLEQARVIAEEHLDKNSDAYASVLNNLAFMLVGKGEYEKALEQFFQALKIEEKEGNIKESIPLINNIALCYAQKGDFEESLVYYTRAMQIIKTEYDSLEPKLANSYHTIAKIFQKKQLWDTALVLHHKAIDLLSNPLIPKGEVNVQYMIGYHLEIGKIHLEQQKVYKARSYLDKAQQFCLKHLGKPSLRTLGISARSYQQEGNYTKAQQIFKQVLSGYQREYQAFKTHLNIGQIHKHLAENYYSQKKYPESLYHYQQALVHFSENFDQTEILSNPALSQLYIDKDIFHILRGKAQCLLQIYQQNPREKKAYLPAANATYQLALDMIQLQRQSLLAFGSKIQLSETVIPIYEGALEALVLQDDGQLSPATLHKAFQIAESSKAILLLESINEQSAKGFSGIPDSLLAQERSLKNEWLFYQKKIREEKTKGAKANEEKVVGWEEALFRFRRQHQEMIADFEKNYPRYHQLKYETRLASIQEVQQKLPTSSSAMVEYFIGKKNNYLFYIDKSNVRMIVRESDENLAREVDQLRNLLKEPYPQEAQKNFDQYTAIAHHLYQELLEVLDIPESIDQLFITPDDWISYIPFEVLLSQVPSYSELDYSPENLSYLIEDYAISYNYSATLWLQDKEAPLPNQKGFIGFAPSFSKGSNPSLSLRDCNQGDLYQLQCNEQEVKQISDLLSGDYYLDAAASKARFLSTAENYRILHLATHSCLNDQDPMASKIFFTDHFISNYDLYNLQLHAELTVLSACNTGNGPLLRGEGIMSLSRGFVHAGCPSTLISMWPVEDCTTADLMLTYYRALKNGMTKAKALQKAKLKYLQETDRLHAHPVYWAPFVQFGETAALEWQQGWDFFSLGYLLGLGLFFMSLWLVYKKIKAQPR